nr:hypothetical protein TgIb.1540c [Toxoplasma gondii RH]
MLEYRLLLLSKVSRTEILLQSWSSPSEQFRSSELLLSNSYVSTFEMTLQAVDEVQKAVLRCSVGSPVSAAFGCVTASKTVQVLPGISPAPTLSIVGNRQVQSRRDEVTSLAVSVAACPYARLGKEIKITWTMRGTGDSRPLDSLVDPFRNSLYMAIDPRKLVAGASYAVKATAAYAVQPVGASESSSVTFQVTTEKASLKLQFCVEPLRTGGTT